MMPKTKLTSAALALSMLVGGTAFAEFKPVKTTSQVEIAAEFMVDAPPAKVWKDLTTWEGFTALAGFQLDPKFKGKMIKKEGDQAKAKVWSDNGVLFATYLKDKKEIRMTWEPENGSYLCQKRMILQPSGKGTKVMYSDRYTTDEDQNSAKNTANQVIKEGQDAVKAWKARVEK